MAVIDALDALSGAAGRLVSLPTEERGGAMDREMNIVNNGGKCELAGIGRGDCGHYVGLSGTSIPGRHDGPDDTVDEYGKPNGWCWQCWKSHQIASLGSKVRELQAVYEAGVNVDRTLSQSHPGAALLREELSRVSESQGYGYRRKK